MLYRREDPDGPVATPIARMLAVADALNLTSLLAGLHRTQPSGSGVRRVDEQMLAAYLRGQPGYRLDVDGTVRSWPELSPAGAAAAATRVDRLIVSACPRRGGQASYTELVAALGAAGYRTGGRAALIARSPLLEPVTRGRYRLRHS